MKTLSDTFWQEAAAAGTLFNKLASLSEIPTNLHKIKSTFKNMLCEKFQLPKSARLHSVWPLTLLPRKRVHSLSVELLNAFVCICPGSRDLGENRITLERIPAHGLTLWQQPEKASVGRWSRATSEFPHRIAVRRRDLSNSLKAELLGYFALCGAQWTGYFYPRWRRANSLVEKGWLG